LIRGCARDSPPHISGQGGPWGGKRLEIMDPLAGDSRATHLKKHFGKKWLVKYCNFIVNIDRSLCGHRYDGIIYVKDIFPRRKPSFMYEGIVL